MGFCMTILESIILGIVEGLTEYLPVSSTGHLIITQYLLGLGDSNAMKAFEVCIQGGAILAVLGLYFKRVKQMARGVSGQDSAGLRLLANMIIAFLPAATIGLLCDEYIKRYLFNAPTVTITWAVGGLVILFYVQRREKDGKGAGGKPLEELGWRGALGIGFLQCVAMCPGTSRSLMTLLGGLFFGLSVSAAVEFSFLLGLITLGGATCYDALKHGADMVESLGWAPLLAGTFTAWLSAILAVKWMVGYLNRHSLALFGWYRLAAALAMGLLIYNGLTISNGEEPTEQASVQQHGKAQG